MKIVKQEITVIKTDENGIKSESIETHEFHEIRIGEYIFCTDPCTKILSIPRDFCWRVGEVVTNDVYDLSKDINPDIIKTYQYELTQKDIDEYIKNGGIIFAK